MSRVGRGERLVQVTWQGLPPGAAVWEQIGKYGVSGQPTGQPTSMYTQIQRRNGVSDISSGWNGPGGNDWQITAQPTSAYTQIQRVVTGPKGAQLSRLNLTQMQGNIRAAAVRQSGAGTASFAQNLLAQGRNS